MTITDRTAEVRRRLDEIEATASRGPWDRRKEHLIRATFAHAAALAGERNSIETYICRGWQWLDTHPDSPGATEKEDKVLAAIEAHKATSDVLHAAMRILTPIEGVELPATWQPGVDWAEVA